MNKNYQMSDLMKAAIVNSLLTVILVNISIVFQDMHKDATFRKEMRKHEQERQRVLEAIKNDSLKSGIKPTGKPDPRIFQKPKQGPQIFVPKQ